MKLTALLLLLASGAALAATEEQFNKTFRVASGGKLVVDVSCGGINVSTNGAADEIAVDVWRKITRSTKPEEEQFLRDYPVEFQHEGSSLTIRERNQASNHWFGNWRNRNEGKFTILVPAQVSATLRTSGGSISVRDLTAEVNANTSGGGLSFARVRGPLNGNTSGGGIGVSECSGDIQIHTSGGGIDVSGGGGSLKGGTSGGGVKVRNFAGPASVKTSGGGITLEQVKGAVKASTSGGPINAVLPSPVPGEVTLSTSGGGVSVKVVEPTAFNLDAASSGGSVSCDLPVTIQGTKKHDRLKGAVNGGGPSVELRSSGGGIRINKL